MNICIGTSGKNICPCVMMLRSAICCVAFEKNIYNSFILLGHMYPKKKLMLLITIYVKRKNYELQTDNSPFRIPKIKGKNICAYCISGMLRKKKVNSYSPHKNKFRSHSST